ncbi:MAG: hypothetical protein HGA54_02560, partial [Actinobacteria bacterium]|nr:hypothetical protein [Actinomycetota bacterium]
MAELILFLASDRAGWINGVSYSIDGGRAQTCARALSPPTTTARRPAPAGRRRRPTSATSPGSSRCGRRARSRCACRRRGRGPGPPRPAGTRWRAMSPRRSGSTTSAWR